MRVTNALMKQALFQANQRFQNGPGDLYTVSSLRDLSIPDYEKVIDALQKKQYVRESGEPEFYVLTHRGEMFGTGQNCPCKECRPQNYR